MLTAYNFQGTAEYEACRCDGGRYGGGGRRRGRRQPTAPDGRGEPQQAAACSQIGTPGQIIIMQPLIVNYIYIKKYAIFPECLI